MGNQLAALSWTATEENTVAGREQREVHLGQRTPCGFRFESVLSVIAALGVHVKRAGLRIGNRDGSKQRYESQYAVHVAS